MIFTILTGGPRYNVGFVWVERREAGSTSSVGRSAVQPPEASQGGLRAAIAIRPDAIRVLPLSLCTKDECMF